MYPSSMSRPACVTASTASRWSNCPIRSAGLKAACEEPACAFLQIHPAMRSLLHRNRRTDRMAQSQPVPPTFTLPPYRPLCKPVTTSPYVARRGSR
ncbi:hypothetical protein VTO73DRAFT_385 [Trametes versicolor]